VSKEREWRACSALSFCSALRVDSHAQRFFLLPPSLTPSCHRAVLAEDAENINNTVDFSAYRNIMAEMQGLTKAFSQLPQNAGGTVSLTPEMLVQVFFFSHA
jgi:hypothetical protein